MMSSPPLCQPAGPHKQKGEMSPPGGGSSEVFQNAKMKDNENIFSFFWANIEDFSSPSS